MSKFPNYPTGPLPSINSVQYWSREFSVFLILAATGRRKAGRQEEPGHTYYLSHSQKPRTPQEVYVGIVGMLAMLAAIFEEEQG